MELAAKMLEILATKMARPLLGNYSMNNAPFLPDYKLNALGWQQCTRKPVKI
jgi:hypothetical protein